MYSLGDIICQVLKMTYYTLYLTPFHILISLEKKYYYLKTRNLETINKKNTAK